MAEDQASQQIELRIPSEILDILLIFDKRLTRLESAAFGTGKSTGLETSPVQTMSPKFSKLDVIPGTKILARRVKPDKKFETKKLTTRAIKFDLQNSEVKPALINPVRESREKAFELADRTSPSKLKYSKDALLRINKEFEQKTRAAVVGGKYHLKNEVTVSAATPATIVAHNHPKSTHLKSNSPRKSKCIYGLVVDEDSDDDLKKEN